MDTENKEKSIDQILENDENTVVKKPNKKKIFIIAGSILLVLAVSITVFFSMVCFHEWEDATCTAPMTCKKCGLTQGEPLNEDDFMNSLAIGLEERWKLTDANEGKEIDTADDWESYFNAEYTAIEKFEDANFADANLSELAKQYVNCIVQSKECLPYVNTNQWASKYSNGVYRDRVVILYEINAIKPIPVSDENQGNLKNLVTEGEATKMVRDLLRTVKFEKSNEEYGWKTYEAVVENTTTIDFSYFVFNVDLVDADGVTLTTATSSVNNWRKGEKTRFTFDTSEDFETMNLDSASWNY